MVSVTEKERKEKHGLKWEIQKKNKAGPIIFRKPEQIQKRLFDIEFTYLFWFCRNISDVYIFSILNKWRNRIKILEYIKEIKTESKEVNLDS